MQSHTHDRGPTPDGEPLTPLERRLQAALKREAGHWEAREPERLRMVCRAPRPDGARAAEWSPVWRWAAVAATLVVATLLTGWPHLRRAPLFKPEPTRVVAATAEELKSLHARLPRFPPLPRPPALVSLRPDRVIVLNR